MGWFTYFYPAALNTLVIRGKNRPGSARAVPTVLHPGSKEVPSPESHAGSPGLEPAVALYCPLSGCCLRPLPSSSGPRSQIQSC